MAVWQTRSPPRPRRRLLRSKGESIGEVVTAVAPLFSRQQPPLELLANGILLARLVGIHRKSWAHTIIGRTRPSCRVGRAIRAAGAGCVVAPLFSRRERKTVLVICAKKLTKLPSGGLNRGPSPSNPQQMPLGWPKRPPKTAHFCSSIFLCQCHKVRPRIGVAASWRSMKLASRLCVTKMVRP